MLRKAAESALGSMDFGQLKQFAYESSAALSTDAQSANLLGSEALAQRSSIPWRSASVFSIAF